MARLLAAWRLMLPWACMASASCQPSLYSGCRLVSGSWNTMLIRRPRTSLQLLVRQRQQVAALEPGLPGHVGARHQAEQGLGRDALARARLADDAERLALPDGERDPAHGVQRAVGRVEADVQVLDVEQRLGAAHGRGGFGHRYRILPGSAHHASSSSGWRGRAEDSSS